MRECFEFYFLGLGKEIPILVETVADALELYASERTAELQATLAKYEAVVEAAKKYVRGFIASSDKNLLKLVRALASLEGGGK